MRRFVKKALITTLCVCVFISSSAAFAGAASLGFKDVKNTDYYYTAVKWAVRSSITTGTSNTTFSPNKECSRAETVTFLWRYAGYPSVYSENCFSDVENNVYFYPAVSWAVENGVTNGTSADVFSPYAVITRAQMVTFLWRYAGHPECQSASSAFRDLPDKSSGYRDAIIWAEQNHIVAGVTKTSFAPYSKCTRGQIVTMIYRYHGYSNKQKLPSMKYIVHAGGQIDNMTGSNSLEAIENSYANGARVLEIDFNFTSDGKLACIHDWSSVFSSELNGTAPTLEKFLSLKIYNRYTPMWIGSLGEYMIDHPDLYIVTDVKDENIRAAGLIAAEYPDLKDRFIIQIYNESEYEPVTDLGFENIIYTLYKLDLPSKTDTKELNAFAADHNLVGYTFADVLISWYPNYLSEMKASEQALFVHTINDPEEQQKYFDMGLDGVYTDYCIFVR